MFKSIISVALFAASAFGAIQFTSAPSAIEAGKSYTFTWTSTGSGPVSILLKNGPSGNLQTVGTITSAGTGGSYTWTAPSDYPPGSYAFEIDQGTDVNYWGPIQYTGGSAASVPASAGVSAAPSTGAAAPSGVSSKAPVQSLSTIASSNKNSTTTSTSSTSSKATSATATPSAPKGTIVTSSNSAASLGSPIALVLGALAAMLYLQ